MRVFVIIFVVVSTLCNSCSLIQRSQEKKQLKTIDNCLAGTVTVVVEKTKELGNVVMGFRGEKSEDAYKKSLNLTGHVGSGSGFIIEQSGTPYVITNAHVIQNASSEQGSLYIYGFNRRKYEVELVGGDSWLDLAVLRFKDEPGEKLEYLSFSKENPRLGERVFAIGTPLGTHPNSVTDGIISALNRTTKGFTGKYGYLQSTATIIWGNSGGPLVNTKGEVVGVNTSIHFAQGADGNAYLQQQMNFSLASEIAKSAIEQIINQGKRVRAHLGIELTYSNQINYSFGESNFMMGESLTPNPMLTHCFDTRVGRKLRPYLGWYLAAINDIEINDLEAALGQFETLSPNETVELTFIDGKNKKEVLKVTPEEMKGEHNLQIAEYVLEEVYNLTLQSNSAQLKVSDGEYTSFVVGAGPKEDHYNNVFRITTPEDLGGVLRIYGAMGGLQLIMSLDGSTAEDDVIDYWQPFDNAYIDDISTDKKLWY